MLDQDSPLSPSSSSIKIGARLQILLDQDCCDQDRRQIRLDQDRRDRDCRQDPHAIIIVLNTHPQQISIYMSRKAGPWGYHDQRFVGSGFGLKTSGSFTLPYNDNSRKLWFAVEEVRVNYNTIFVVEAPRMASL